MPSTWRIITTIPRRRASANKTRMEKMKIKQAEKALKQIETLNWYEATELLKSICKDSHVFSGSKSIVYKFKDHSMVVWFSTANIFEVR